MPHRSMGGWQVDVAGHIVGVAGEAGGWGGDDILKAADERVEDIGDCI